VAADGLLERGLDALGLDEGTREALAKAGCARVRDLVQQTEVFLYRHELSAAQVASVKAALLPHGLQLGMMLDAPTATELDPATASAILAGDPDAIDRLVQGDMSAWQALAEHLLLHPGQVASPAVVRLLLERAPRVADLLDSAEAALWDARSDVFTTITAALRAIRPWLADGVAAALAPDHPSAIDMRYERELSAAEGAGAARALVADVRRVAPARPSLGEALLLLARRAHEDGLFDEALVATIEAEALLSAAGDETSVRKTQRLRGSVLLSLQRFDDAFAVLDPIMIESDRGFGGASRSGGMSDPVAYAISEAATVATWADATTPEWVRALGGMAERTARPDLWQRFEAALVAMVDRSKNPASDLEVVIRQAGQRGLRRTVEAAREIAAARDLDPDAEWNPHFG
jgi:hypothetical protein